MIATVAALAVLTFVIPGNQVASVPQPANSISNSYSAEEVMLEQNEVAENSVSDGQALTEIYGMDEDR